MSSVPLRYLESWLACLALPAHAAPTPAPSAAPSAKGAFQRDLLGVYSYNEKQVLQLEEAVPQSKFNWRPAPGVRSIAEAYLHIAFANYGLTKAATGKEPPADAGWEMKSGQVGQEDDGQGGDQEDPREVLWACARGDQLAARY